MVSEQIFNDMRSFGIPILAVGDHGQLSPVEGAFNLMENPHLRLEKVHRQAEGSPIISLATYIREEGELPLHYDSNEHVRFVHPSGLRDSLQALYCSNLTGLQLTNIALLCYTNAKRRMANALVRQIRWGIKEDDPVREGDLLICLRNSMNVLFNGMRARTISSREHGKYWWWTHVVFDEDDIELKASMFRPQFNRNGTIARHEDVAEYGFDSYSWSKQLGLLFDFGYALTVHKSQGSAFKDTFLLYERPNMVDQDEFRRWLYTAATRASERLHIITR
jgi:exodeoxyribonuclease-5